MITDMSLYPFDCITDFIFVRNDESIPPCDVLLIPGGSHPQLMERACHLYKQKLAKFILVSGGANPKLPDYPSEARFLQCLALAEGIPPEAVLCEEKASNTYENALYSYELIKEKGLDNKRLILVCKAFHSRRALLSYQKVFPPATRFYVSSVTDKNGLNRDNWFTKEEYIQTVMREVEKIGRYFADDILPMYQQINDGKGMTAN